MSRKPAVRSITWRSSYLLVTAVWHNAIGECRAKTEVRKPPSLDAHMLDDMSDSKRLSGIGRPATDAEWAAISTRHGRHFLFVVTSTGIICTPGCPARTPGRDRIRVISRFDEGLAAGARACLRCRPDELFGTPTIPSLDPVQTAIARMAAALTAGDDVPTERELAGELHLTERRLRELFRGSLAVTPRAWLSARRAEMLRSRLADGQDVTAALYDAGYGSSSAAYEAANGELGMAPGRYSGGAVGESIRWTIAPIPEGVALVAVTARGLCSVHGPRPVLGPPGPLLRCAGSGSPRRIPARGAGPGRRRSGTRRLHRGRPGRGQAAPRGGHSAARRPRDGVSAAGLGGVAPDPLR